MLHSNIDEGIEMPLDALQRVAPLAGRLLSSSFAPYLFSVAVVALTFKQLQQGSSVGAAELFAALVCVLLAGAALFSGKKLPLRPLFVATCFVVFVGAAATVAFLTDPQRLNIRDGIAYCFTFFICCTFILASNDREVDYLQSIVLTISLVLFLFVLVSVVPSSIQNLMYYQGTRKLQGLSNNPNQIAFLAVVGLGFLAVLDLLRKLPVPMLLLVSGACGLAGAMSGSSAFTFAVAATLVLALVVACTNFLRGKRVRLPLSLIVPASILLLAYIPVPTDVDFVTPVSAVQTSVSAGSHGDLLDMEADNGQGSARLLLWSNAISAVSKSPLVGLGPGAHVPLISPSTGGVTLNEAHNTVVDILIVSGIFGLVAFLVLAGFVLWNAHKYNVFVPLLVCLMPVASYALFHYLGRQPLFWIAIYLSAGSIPLLLRCSGDVRPSVGHPAEGFSRDALIVDRMRRGHS